MQRFPQESDQVRLNAIFRACKYQQLRCKNIYIYIHGSLLTVYLYCAMSKQEQVPTFGRITECSASSKLKHTDTS